MVDINTLTEKEFKKMPLVVEGESKEVRYAGKGLVVIRYKPTIYSFKANRCGVVEGSDVLRLRATKIFLDVLREAGVKHAYHEVNDSWVLADLILQPVTRHDPKPFRPNDLSEEEIQKLAVAPPIEVVIKCMHSGTSKHRYFGMAGFSIRGSHPFYSDVKIQDDKAYPQTMVRFDWRNPLYDRKKRGPKNLILKKIYDAVWPKIFDRFLSGINELDFLNPNGNRLADEILAENIADWFIDVKQATQTALAVDSALEDFLNEKDIVHYDLCLFITEDGKTVFGEVSQDCGRYRHYELGSLDKDVWRAGGSSKDVLAKWQLLLDLISQ